MGDLTHLISKEPLLARQRPWVARIFCSDPKHVFTEADADRSYRAKGLSSRFQVS